MPDAVDQIDIEIAFESLGFGMPQHGETCCSDQFCGAVETLRVARRDNQSNNSIRHLLQNLRIGAENCGFFTFVSRAGNENQIIGA